MEYVYFFIYLNDIITTGSAAVRNHANSFWGDVVLDSFNSVSRDEDNILD